jgi:hypothetical protein
MLSKLRKVKPSEMQGVLEIIHMDICVSFPVKICEWI